MNKMFSAVPTSALLIISYQNNVVLIRQDMGIRVIKILNIVMQVRVRRLV